MTPQAPRGQQAQPIAQITWIHRDELRANDYNPNTQAPPEHDLLRVSLLEDGWTQPLLVRPASKAGEATWEIIDGFHRWSLSADPQVYALTDGYVPCVIKHHATRADQMLATIRANRARGEHGVLRMADIVRDMVDAEGLTFEQIMDRCGMEKEEVTRLYDRGGMTERGTQGKTAFSQGWVPK